MTDDEFVKVASINIESLNNALKNIPKDGVRGLWTYWNKSGRKIEEGYFSKNGVAKGNWSYWDKNGRKRLGKKINYDTFNNKDALKHLDGYFLVS